MITTLKKIYFRKRKKEPDIKEIEELLKHHDVKIINATFDYMEKLLKYFEEQYIWRIFVFDKNDIHDNPFIPYFPSDYYYSREYIRKKFKKVNSIYMQSLEYYKPDYYCSAIVDIY